MFTYQSYTQETVFAIWPGLADSDRDLDIYKLFLTLIW